MVFSVEKRAMVSRDDCALSSISRFRRSISSLGLLGRRDALYLRLGENGINVVVRHAEQPKVVVELLRVKTRNKDRTVRNTRFAFLEAQVCQYALPVRRDLGPRGCGSQDQAQPGLGATANKRQAAERKPRLAISERCSWRVWGNDETVAEASPELRRNTDPVPTV